MSRDLRKRVAKLEGARVAVAITPALMHEALRVHQTAGQLPPGTPKPVARYVLGVAAGQAAEDLDARAPFLLPADLPQREKTEDPDL